MSTKINFIRRQSPTNGILLTSWLEKNGLSRSEIHDYMKSGWLQRISIGVYKFAGDEPSLYGILASYQKQVDLKYHIGAASALELKGFSHYISMGKPTAIVFAPVRPPLPKWLSDVELDMNVAEVSSKVIGTTGIEQMDYQGQTLTVSSPERAIMECILLSPSRYDLTYVYYLMEMLTSLRVAIVQRLLEECTSVKVKRLFLYMAEKAHHRWFSKLDLSRISLGQGTRSLAKKSKLGGDSTLINSNKDLSNFVFEIQGINDAQMSHINSLDKFKQKFEYIRKVGGTWSFSNVSGEILKNNLTMLDLGMAHIIAACMEKYYTGQGSEVAVVCQKVAEDDPLHINCSKNQPMYAYKIKQFLLAFALGMTVSSPWDGTFNANGGYIVVKEDGDVICYHFFDRNDLEDYLFNNTKFDTPSTTRHEFGEVYKVKDSYFIKLNLQIRFIK